MTLETPRSVAAVALLVAAMRASGARVGLKDVVRARRALAAGSEPYYALRRTLCSHEEDFAAFDAAFAEWFPRHLPQGPIHAG